MSKNLLIIHKGLREFGQSLVQKRKEQIRLILNPWEFRSTEDPFRASDFWICEGGSHHVSKLGRAEGHVPAVKDANSVLLVYGRVMDVLY